MGLTAGAAHDCGYAAVNGLSMYYEVHGDGPPLVLMHGAFGTIDACFGRLLPRLAATRKVIAVELQGHGRTADIDRPLTYEAMTDDIIELVRELGLTVADFVGYSMGGGVALQVALRAPSLARRVVFAGGVAYRPEGFHPALLAAIETSKPDDLDGSSWHHAYTSIAPDPGAWHSLVAKVNELDRTFIGYEPHRLRAITTPTMLIIGDADIVRPAHTVEMFELLGGGVPGDLVGVPDAQLAILPGTTHVGLLDQVVWLDQLITGFLDQPCHP
jgi:pimeloyl-ACP methyl ester carboxylesterase